MAKRKLNEINAGSMADIAFLLLIFFLVTTTMEVDAGISRQLPLKNPDQVNLPEKPIHERDMLKIKTNSKDQLFVENELIELNELEAIVVEFFTVNEHGIRSIDMPYFHLVTTSACQIEISKLQEQLEVNPDNKSNQKALKDWQTRMSLCVDMGGQYNEIAPMALVHIENQSETSYGLYIEIQNILKKVVNDLRAKKCKSIFNRDYFLLDETSSRDQEIIEKLRILVPERVFDAKIKK